MGVMGRFTHPIPLGAPLELPAPYPILPLPDWTLKQTDKNESVARTDFLLQADQLVSAAARRQARLSLTMTRQKTKTTAAAETSL